MKQFETGFPFLRLEAAGCDIIRCTVPAIEAAKACKTYAFEILKADEVCSIIRDTNIASQKVAMRNGMTMTDTWTKHYRGVEMPHYRYVAHHSL